MWFQADASPSAPRMAREALRQWLAIASCPDGVTSDVLLLVSELTTNAVVHAGTAATIAASFDDGRLRIEVHDECQMPPRIRDQPDASGGWGLRLVAAIADGWGWNPTLSGKQVWAEMLC